MKHLLLLAFLLPFPLFRSSGERTNQAAWDQLLAAFNLRGVVVSSDHPVAYTTLTPPTNKKVENSWGDGILKKTKK